VKRELPQGDTMVDTFEKQMSKNLPGGDTVIDTFVNNSKKITSK
jgi:hypothetical protein